MVSGHCSCSYIVNYNKNGTEGFQTRNQVKSPFHYVCSSQDLKINVLILSDSRSLLFKTYRIGTEFIGMSVVPCILQFVESSVFDGSFTVSVFKILIYKMLIAVIGKISHSSLIY